MESPDGNDKIASVQDATQADEHHELLPRLLIAPIAILIATVMIGLPVLRILTAGDDDTTIRQQAANQARGQVAVLFASAVLESRSVTIAQRYAVEDAHERMRVIINDLQRREPGDLAGAVSSTARTACQNGEPGQECFVARLARSGEDAVVEMPFVVGIVDGVARVVSIGNANPTVLLGRHNRAA